MTEQLGHWSDCAVYNEPAMPKGPCSCGGLDLAAYERYRRVTSLIPDPGGLAAFIYDGEAPSLIETEQLPSGALPTSATATNLPDAHNGVVSGAGANRMDFDNASEAVIGDREALPLAQSIAGNMPPHDKPSESIGGGDSNHSAICVDQIINRRTYSSAMGEAGAHIRLKLDTSEPISLSDFVAEFVGIGNQFEKFVAREFPAFKGESEFYIKEVRSGCIEADFVAWVVGSGSLLGIGVAALDAMDKLQIFTKFVQDFGSTLSRYFKPGGRADNVSRGDLGDFLKTTEAIATDPNGSLLLEAAAFEDGKRQIKAAFKFRTPEARIAEQELITHRKELEAKTDTSKQRVLLRFVRPSIEAGKPGKKGGERGIIESISKRAMTILYASDLPEERMRYEKMQIEGNVFRALFDVSVSVEVNASQKPIAYRIMEVHAVIPDGDEDDLLQD